MQFENRYLENLFKILKFIYKPKIISKKIF